MKTFLIYYIKVHVPDVSTDSSVSNYRTYCLLTVASGESALIFKIEFEMKSYLT